MSLIRKKGRMPKSDVNASGRMDSGKRSKLSTLENNSEENSVDDFDISTTDNGGKQSLSPPFQNLVTSKSDRGKSQQKRQHSIQVDLNKNSGDPDDSHDLAHSNQRQNISTDWNELKDCTVMDLADSVVTDINLDNSDILVHRTNFFSTSTPCPRKSERARRAMKWTDDFVVAKAICTKSKRPRLSMSDQISDGTLETSDHQADVGVVSVPVVKRRKTRGVLTDHEDSGASYEQMTGDNLSVGITGNGSTLFEEKECEKVKPQGKRGRPRKNSDSFKQQLPLDKSSMSDSQRNKKKFPCSHCEDVKRTTAALRTHMALKHHRVWTAACPEGILDEYHCYKVTKSIRCLKCDKMCNTFSTYQNHVKFCGREGERVDCEVCGKNVRLTSYNAHVRYMHKRKAAEAETAKAEKKAEETDELPAAEISSNTGRSLRRAAVKARKKLREITTDIVPTNSSDSYSKPQYICPDGTFPADFLKKLQDKMEKLHRLTCCYQGCSIEHSEVSELVAHLLICSHKPDFVCNPEDFTCLACGISFKFESEVVDHVTQHDWSTPTQERSSSESEGCTFSSSDESTDDDEDDEGEDGKSDASGAKHSRRQERSKLGLLPMDAFLQQHCWSDLFPNWEAKQCLYEALPVLEESHYLPQNHGLAIKIQTSETEFSRTVKLGLFETYRYNDSYNINVGGPIWAVAWCPVPPGKQTDQYLAVYAHRTADETHSVNECSNQMALVQFWRFHLHDQKAPESEKPEMIGGLLLDCGPIWEMKWCPTGSWNEGSAGSILDSSRIGLLAVASHSGDVHILSVPKRFPMSSEEQHVRLYRATPVATLKRRGRTRISPCLCLDWHWKEGCGMLVAGFADGTTCLWDLNITSSLLCQKAEDGRDWLFPFQSIRSHVWPVKGVAFCQTQLNLIATCSADSAARWTTLFFLGASALKQRQAFSVIGPSTWNELPLMLRLLPRNNVSSFSKLLKTFLFGRSWTESTSELVKLWDLTEPECPLATYHNTFNTGVIWPVNGASTFACSGDDCYLLEHNGTILCSYATNRLLTRPLTVHNASIWGMSYNCWLHCLVSCDCVGVVVRAPWIAINAKSISEYRQVLFLVEMSDGSAEEASCQMPLSVDVKKEPNDVTTTNRNGGNQVTKAARQNSSDACECNCHGNQTAEACENSKSNPVTDCRHCQLQRCLLFKDFSKEWQFSNIPLFFAKQLPPDDIHNSLPCSLNRIAWNTNYGFHKWLATGGQAGILRVKLIKDIEQHHSKKHSKKHKKRRKIVKKR